MANLEGMKVAILRTDGFEQALDEASADTRWYRPRTKARAAGISRTGVTRSRSTYPSTKPRPQAFEALLLPGGVMNPDTLRMLPKAVAFVRAFFDAGRPVASICHGPWTVIEAGPARGRRVTSWPSHRTALRNAGAEWVDQEAVTDRGLVTTASPMTSPCSTAR